MNIDIYHSLSYRGRKKIYVYTMCAFDSGHAKYGSLTTATHKPKEWLAHKSNDTIFFLLSFKVNIDKFWHFVSYSLEHSSENEKLVAYLLLLLFCFRSLFLMLSSLCVHSFPLSSYTCWLFVPSTFFSLLSEFSTILFAWLAIVQIMRHYFHVDRAFA